MHRRRTQEVKQAIRGAFSLHHISLIHFLVEWVKLPAKRNVGQRGRLSEQRAAGKQTKQTQNSRKLGHKKHQDAFKKDSKLIPFCKVIKIQPTLPLASKMQQNSSSYILNHFQN